MEQQGGTKDMALYFRQRTMVKTRSNLEQERRITKKETARENIKYKLG